jgi:hypothetical protein
MPFRKEGWHPQASPHRSRTSRQGFLLTPTTTTLNDPKSPPNMSPSSMRHHGLDYNFAVSLRTPSRGLEEGEGQQVRGSSTAAVREGTTSTAFAVADRT